LSTYPEGIQNAIFFTIESIYTVDAKISKITAEIGQLGVLSEDVL
jgi:hypothetical protein